MIREEILPIAKPILFNTEMVHAILDNRKKATRRLMKPQPVLQNNIWMLDGAGWSDGVTSVPIMPGHSLYRKAKYNPGDYLYIRETWCNVNKSEYEPDYYYFADTRICEDYDSTEWTWKPSIHMPKDAARLFLKVKEVHIEQLKQMTVDDVLQEGVSGVEPPPICIKGAKEPEGFRSWSKDKQDDWIESAARATYIGWLEYADKVFSKMQTLWDSTIKKDDADKFGWNANPWVWVIEFERIEVQ